MPEKSNSLAEAANALTQAANNLASRVGQNGVAENPMRGNAEEWVQNVVQWLRLGVETTGALVIGIGILVALWAFLRALATREPANFNAIRLGFARYLALALEFQLSADVLSTAITPTWDAIARLAAIAIIRTALNFFLIREINEETKRAENEKSADGRKHDNPSEHIVV